MVVAFAASQMGWIENLVYVTDARGERNSFGIIYPTDFAAHVFYLVIAASCLMEDKIKVWKTIPIISLAFFVYTKCDARTSFLCMILLVGVLLFIKYFKDKMENNSPIYYMTNSLMILLAGIYIVLTHAFNIEDERMLKINDILSYRLYYSDIAIQKYEYKLFGQNIEQKGWGNGFDIDYEYFFLDDSYIRVALMYGVVLFVVMLIIFYLCGIYAINCRRVIVLFGISIIAVHCFMEHHILDIAYNPMICFLFTKRGLDIDKEQMGGC